MKTNTRPLTLARHGERQRKAFTLAELAVVVSVLLLLAVVGASALSGAKDRTRIAQCAANLRQFTLALEIYGNENRGFLPTVSSANWPWDMPWGLADALAGLGAQRNNQYCPANPGQNADALWNWLPNQFRVIGYAMTLPGMSLNATNLNSSVVPQSISSGSILMPPPPPALRVLLADATISSPGGGNEANRTLYNYVDIAGGYYLHHRTSHLDGLLPSGGNLGMLDGHVEWHEFPDMHVRSLPGPGSLTWWW